MDQLIYAYLSLTHCWYKVDMLKVPAVQTRDSAVSRAKTMTELVIVEAVRVSDSGVEAMGEAADSISEGEGSRLGTCGPRTFLQSYSHSQTQHKPAENQRQSLVDASFKVREKISCIIAHRRFRCLWGMGCADVLTILA